MEKEETDDEHAYETHMAELKKLISEAAEDCTAKADTKQSAFSRRLKVKKVTSPIPPLRATTMPPTRATLLAQTSTRAPTPRQGRSHEKRNCRW